MKKLWAVFRIYLYDTLSYRGDLLLYTLSGVVFPVIVLLIWLVVDSTGNVTFFTRNDFIIYFLASLVIRLWTSAWGGYFIARDIRYGKLSPFLIRPVPYLFFQIGNNLAEKFFKSLYLIPIIAIIAIIFGAKFPLLSISSWILIILTTLGAAVIYFIFDICIGFSAFWLDDSTAIAETWDLLMSFFSGRLIPLIALPLFWQHLSVFLPFRYTLSFPIEIILGKLSDVELIVGLGFQMIWLIVCLLLYSILWRIGRRKYSASGA